MADTVTVYLPDDQPPVAPPPSEKPAKQDILTAIGARFARESVDHAMTIKHDDGLYRHLRFQSQKWKPPLLHPVKSSFYWFDLITVPGALIFQGDGESFVFARLTDMFEFFRLGGYDRKPNLGYWAEKLTSNRDSAMRYSQPVLEEHIWQAVENRYGDDPVPDPLTEAIRFDLLDELCGDEHEDRRAVDSFAFYMVDGDRYATPRKAPDFEFQDSWEWNLRDYDWWYVWACYAIVWGIAQYDAAQQPREAVSTNG